MIKMVAEIGSNHNNDWDRCCDLMMQAKNSGFSAVKFQLFKSESITKNKDLQKKYREQELNVAWLPKIKEFCTNTRLEFGISPFYLDAIEQAKDYVDFFKISSFDILRTDLIQKCLEIKKDVYFSCGLAGNDEIRDLINLVLSHGSEKSKYYFMHCVSKYPTNYKEAAIKRMADLFILLLRHRKEHLLIGYSDHTADIDVIREAINNYASCIELHFDLNDEKGCESGFGHCWTPVLIDELYNKMEKVSYIVNGKFELTKEQIKLRADKITGLRN